MSAAPGFDRQRIGAMMRRQGYVQKRSWHRWFDVAIWPVVDTVIWGSIGIFVDQQGGSARSGAPYMLTGILLMHVLYQSNISVAMGFLDETWSRNLPNILVSPIREREFMVAIVLFGLLKLAMGLAMVALAALVLYSFNILEAGWALIPIIGVLMIVGWCIALYVISFVLRFGTGAEILAWGILFIVVALSGVFYPPDALPTVLQPLAYALPSTHMLEAARTVLDGEPMPWQQVGYALATLAFFVPIALLYLRHMLNVFRDRGYVTRYL